MLHWDQAHDRVFDYALSGTAAVVGLVDWQRWRAGLERRPWWRFYWAVSVLFLAFAILDPGGHGL